MLKFFNANKKSSLKKLEVILNSRKLSQQNKSSIVKKIISTVKKNGDKAVIKYEKKVFKKLNPKKQISFLQKKKSIKFQKK